MIERIIENWLTRVSERDFEIPFCQLLAAKGYKVVHLTRHGPTEEGKDVIAIAPDGEVVAYQLKSGNISLADWLNISGEIHELTTLKPRHPSVSRKKWHRAVLVTTGQLSEEVRLRVDHYNEDHADANAKLEVVVQGQLLKDFMNLHGTFLPSEVPEFSRFLRLLLADGQEMLSAGEVASFFVSVLPLTLSDESRNKSEIARALASALVLCNYLSVPYQLASNHVALIDLWIIMASHVLAVAERYGLAKKYWHKTFLLVNEGVRRAFEAMITEVDNRDHYYEGDPLTDNAILGSRLALITGYLSGYAVSCMLRDNNNTQVAVLDELIADQLGFTCLWGEAAIPQFLAVAWYLERSDRTEEAAQVVDAVLQFVLATQGTTGLPDPYHDLQSVLASVAGAQPFAEDFAGLSYSVQTLVEWLVRHDRRESVAGVWRAYTDTQQAETVVIKPHETYLWYTEHAEVVCRLPGLEGRWTELKSAADGYSENDVPRLLREYPWFTPLFLLVYPHRLRPLLSWWVDRSLR